MTGAPLRLYNSLTRRLEIFEPIDPAMVRLYSCGPTVYNYAHIGNLRAYVFTDTLSRVLTWKGYSLTHVINITDVGHLTSDADAGDDKMEAAARAQATSIWDIAAHYTAAFKQNLADLNICAPSRWSVATDHIADMIAFAEQIAPNHCYELDSGLYFDVTTVPDYGALAGGHDDAAAGRIDAVAGKRHPQDFAIWRKSAPGENRQMEWDSPWGRGAPGWHLECSVMSKKYLGTQFDIHTGGIDHREIHHPNEIAQNQAHCECPETGANWWMHNNFLVERAGKMSKSAGGFTTLKSLIDKGVHPLAYRLMCLQAHYRSELEFSWDGLVAAQVRLKRLVMAMDKIRSKATLSDIKPLKTYRETRGIWLGKEPRYVDGEEDPGIGYHLTRFDDAVSDDLKTPEALLVLENVLAINPKVLNPDNALEIVATIDSVLGLRLLDMKRAELRIRPITATLDDQKIESLLGERREARAAKNFARSDTIRDTLATAGVEVMDGDPLGWDWKLAL